MIGIVYISLLFLSIYLSVYISLKGIPRSISDTYYDITGPKWIFTILMWSMAFTVMPCMLEVSSLGYEFLAFLSGAGIAFVGAAPLFKPKKTIERKIHIGGAAISGLCSQVWLGVYNPTFLLLWFIAPILVKLLGSDKLLFSLEIVAILDIYLALFIML